MDRGGCRLNGGQGGESGGLSSGAGGGMITLEDLESFSEDQQSDSGNGSLEEGETMADDEQERLLHYWQDVARGHQVEVPRDMAGPIQQLTTNNDGTQDRQPVPSTLIIRKEKCGTVLYEKRHYEKAYWACITIQEETYEQSICHGFMKLMRYICQQNSSGSYLGMTIPIVTVVRTDEAHTALSQAVTVAYYLPPEFQGQPPQPFDGDIIIEEWPATIIYARAFSGATNEQTILNEINVLADILESPGIFLSDSFIVASYSSPADANRRNEIWFLERP
ncbi:heme-binding protein soul3 [Paramormyrops kingsleyae]|uniref:Heme-binding protein soul3 n=1 Tax=Paramormyrops kingsleyae TaxID=1676925 RepID=A0A3B3R713_9TELE|nr:heme-binding protein 1-like [Paramormyrops kingsleyae]